MPWPSWSDNRQQKVRTERPKQRPETVSVFQQSVKLNRQNEILPGRPNTNNDDSGRREKDRIIFFDIFKIKQKSKNTQNSTSINY